MLKVGDIYAFNRDRVLIIMFDKNEVFFLSLGKNDELHFPKAKTMIYQRTPHDFFISHADFIRSSNLSREFIEIHQPNLPLRLNCIESVFWSNEEMNKAEFKAFVMAHTIEIDKLQSLNCEQFVLVPNSQLATNKTSTKIKNQENSITGFEFLYKCFQVQNPHVNPEKPYFSQFRLIQDGREEKRLSGIGVYRLGIKGNIPSYYLGGAVSMAEIQTMKKTIIH